MGTCPSCTVGNGTLNKLAGIDFKQLSLSHKLNENQSGEVGAVLCGLGPCPVLSCCSVARCREGAPAQLKGLPPHCGAPEPHKGPGASAPISVPVSLLLQLWKGRWQGNDIVIKILKIRDWTTRKSRDFNEEYPKLR